MKKSLLTGTLGLIVLGVALGSVCLVTGKCQARTESVWPPGSQSLRVQKKKQASKQIRWFTSLDAARKASKSSGKPIFVDFYATWCPPCKMLDKETYSDSRVVAESQKWIMVKIDTDKQLDVAMRYGITNLPTLARLNSDGIPIMVTTGFLEAPDFLRFLRDAKAASTSTERE